MMHGEKKGIRRGLAACLAVIFACLPLSSLGEQSRYEGPGWDTPEEALAVYLEGLKEQDLGKVISAYAIETYAEGFNLAAQTARVGAYSVNLSMRLPNAGPLAQSLNIETRKNEVVNTFYWQLLSICLPGEDFLQPQSFAGEDREAEAAAFVGALEEALTSVNFGTLQLVRLIPPEEISEVYLSAKNQENMLAQAGLYGAEEKRSLIALFTVDEKVCILCCDALRYQERWYLSEGVGNIGIIIGLAASTGGVVAADRAELTELLDVVEGEELEGLEALLYETLSAL